MRAAMPPQKSAPRLPSARATSAGPRRAEAQLPEGLGRAARPRSPRGRRRRRCRGRLCRPRAFLHTARERFRVIGAVCRQRVLVTLVGTGHDVHHERGVRHRACHGPDVREAPRRAVGMGRHAAVRGLEAEDAGARRGNPDRAPAVGADVQRGQTGGGRCGRSAARAARRAVDVPGVAVGPNSRLCVAPIQPTLGVFVLPIMIARGPSCARPSGRPRSPVVARRGRAERRANVPRVMRSSAERNAVGAPSFVPRFPSARSAALASRRPVRVDEYEGVEARIESLSMRSSTPSTSSTGETSSCVSERRLGPRTATRDRGQASSVGLLIATLAVAGRACHAAHHQAGCCQRRPD